MYGLTKLKLDLRDLSFFKVVGGPKTLAFPKDFNVPKKFPIQDQLFYDFCAAFASTATSEDQEGVKLSEAWQFAKAMQINGKLTEYGCDLRTMCKSFTQFGSLEEKDAPFKLGTQPRNFLADWKNWSFNLDSKAALHKKMTFLRGDTGPYDVFDNLRATIWQSNTAVISGATWKQEWWYPPQGVIPKTQFNGGSGHAFVIRGWKDINGEAYLIVQLSNGQSVGDKGYVYFPREVVNREFNYGCYTFVDIDPDQAKLSWGTIQKLLNYVYKLINPIMDQTPSQAILARAISLVGQDASPSDQAPDELACAESVSTIINSLYPTFPIIISTAELYAKLKGYSNWKQLDTPQAGCVIISPTGMGNNPQMPHGHTGIVGENGLIYSNSSFSNPVGKWEQNFTIDSWKERYVKVGGYPVYYFQKWNV